MKTKELLFSLMFVMSQQVFGYTIKTDTVVIHYEKYQLEQIIVSINNTDDEPLWIWLDETGKYQNEKKAIKHYLMGRHGGDVSIFLAGSLNNVKMQWWRPSNLFFFFVKYLEPGNKFTVILYREIERTINYAVNDEEEVYFKNNERILDIVKIYTDRQIKEYSPIPDYGIKRISYPHDIIVCPIREY